MEYYKNILCVRARWLIENHIMSEIQYKHMVVRRQINIIRPGCRNTPALVTYESIPERFKGAIREVLGCDPYDAGRVSEIEKHITHSGEESQFFEEYMFDGERHLPKDTQREYYANAIVLTGIRNMINDKRAARKARGLCTPRKWKDIAEGVQELDRTRFPHSLPANPRRLEDRYRKYIKGGPASLIHGNFQNKNSAKVDDEIKESYLTELIGGAKNLDNAQVARIYNMIANEAGWKSITPAAVAVWRNKMDLTTYAGRRGSVAFSNKKAMQVKRYAPTAPLYYWTLDGWDVELLYQITEDGRTTYHHRPTVVIVLDPCLKYPVGYAIGTHETPELINAALRNAARHTEELFGRMYRVNQLQSDRYAIKKMMPLYEIMAKKVTPARAKNAKSKVIEPQFGDYNKRYCQILFANWSGFGIASDPEKQPNSEYLNRCKKDFPDYAGVCSQIDKIIQMERASKVDRYLELWDRVDETRKVELSHESYLLNFGDTTGNRILLQGSGLHPTILGQRRNYDCFDITFRDHASVKWKVIYDPADLSRVLAINEDETLRYVLEEKHIQPMALADRKPGDSEALQRVRNFNNELEGAVIERRARSGSIVREHIKQTRMIEDETLRRLLITDSTGQHKDVKNRERMLAAGKKKVQECEVVCEEYGEVISHLDYAKSKVDVTKYID